MVTCFFTWTRWDEEKGKYIEYRCPEKTWKGSKEFCIFHDPSLEKDIELFKQKLEKKFTRNDLNFHGFHFPRTWGFSRMRFSEKAGFVDASFQEVSFMGATFQKNAQFFAAEFQGWAGFFSVVFQGDVSFIGATFQKNANFGGATFQKNADFKLAVIERNIELTLKYVDQLDIRHTQFLLRGHIVKKPFSDIT